MSTVPRPKPRSEYQGAYKDLQEQIDELRRKIEEIQASGDGQLLEVWRLERDRKPVIDDSTYYTDDD